MLADGCWGHLTGAAIKEFQGSPKHREPQVWELGVKEIWKVNKPLDRVIHTIGPWPLKLSAKYGQIGGTWIYPMKDEKTGDDLVSIGFVVDLEYADATTSAHDLLQLFKTHPLVPTRDPGGRGADRLGREGSARWRVLVDAEALDAGRTAPLGNAGGMVDTVSLKGVHHCITAGKLAAEAIYANLKDGKPLTDYQEAIEESRVGKELYKVRNTRQPFQKGFLRGGPAVNLSIISGSSAARSPGLASQRRQARLFMGDTCEGIPEAGRQIHLRQTLQRLHQRQRDP